MTDQNDRSLAHGHHGASMEDEIDLRELASIVIDGWKWLVFTPLLALAIAGAIILSCTPSFTTEFRARPADPMQFPAIVRSGGIRIDSTQLFQNFAMSLASFENFRQSVIEDPTILAGSPIDVEDQTELLTAFNDQFTVSYTPGEDGELIVQRHYRGDEPGVESLNLYLESTAARVWAQTTERLSQRNASAIARLENDIAQQQETLRLSREERLFELEQNITIARNLGIEMPTTPQDFGRQSNDAATAYPSIDVNGTLPMYFFGYRALEAEKTAIEEGLNLMLSDGMIRMAQERLREHQNVAELFAQGEFAAALGLGNLPAIARLVAVTEYPLTPVSPEGPGKALILALALLVGGFLGFIMTFIDRFVRSVIAYRASRKAPSAPVTTVKPEPVQPGYIDRTA